MIKRRSVRIKVLQAAYGFEHGDTMPLKNFSKTLVDRILSVKEIYTYNLLVIQVLSEMVELEAQNKASKHIRTEADHAFSTKLLSNIFVQLLCNNETYQEVVDQAKLRNHLDDPLMATWYKNLKASAGYQNYLSTEVEFNPATDLEIIRFIYKEILLTDEDFHNHMQDLYSNWIDDAGFISSSILQTLEKSKNKLNLVFEREGYDSKMDELTEFGVDLLNHTINGKEQQLERIATKLNNWDVERLASTDILILRMALAELINFPSIPTKVTINEYIDIAKEYSTPKSKDFINGILDNLTKELMEKGIILKEGRGLKES